MRRNHLEWRAGNLTTRCRFGWLRTRIIAFRPSPKATIAIRGAPAAIPTMPQTGTIWLSTEKTSPKNTPKLSLSDNGKAEISSFRPQLVYVFILWIRVQTVSRLVSPANSVPKDPMIMVPLGQQVLGNSLAALPAALIFSSLACILRTNGASQRVAR